MRWQDEPFKIEVKAGDKKSFCRCGKTKNPPYCDGSHKGTSVEPYRETFDKDRTVSICGCASSKIMPYCDGSHRCFLTNNE